MARSRDGGKSAAAFRTISEVSEELDVPQHVLRFWETKFSQVKPLKRGGGRRYYRPEDIELLRRIRALLYSDGYTIKGVQKLLREGGGRGARAAAPERTAAEKASSAAKARPGAQSDRPAGLSSNQRARLEGLRRDLRSLRESLRALPGGA
jgi:DNA-binding transcriptional MerR regulator